MASTNIPATAPPQVSLSQEYQRAIQHVSPSGRTSYRYAHPIGLTTGDQTSFMGGQEDWSEDHLPDLAYQLNPQAENMVLRVQLPAQCTTGNGQLRYGIVIKADGTGVRHPVLDFLILPAKVSRTAPAWLVVMWMRFDPRIRWFDVLVRMKRGQRPKANTLQMRCARWRFDFGLKAWDDSKGGNFHQSKESEDVELLLTLAQRQANTTRGTTPGPSNGWSSMAVVPKVTRKVRAAQIESAKWAVYLDINNLSDLSTSESDEAEESNKRSRRSRAQHLKKRRHALKKQKAVGQALQSAGAGEAVVLPARTPQVFIGGDLVIVFKNVIVAPDDVYEEDETTEDEGVANQDETVADNGTIEHAATTWEDDDGYEMSDEYEDDNLEDQSDAQHPQDNVNDVSHCENDMGSFEEDNARSADSDEENGGSKTFDASSQYRESEGPLLAGNSNIINEMGHGYLRPSSSPSPHVEIPKSRKRSRVDIDSHYQQSTKRPRETGTEAQNDASFPVESSQPDTQGPVEHPMNVSDIDYTHDLRSGNLPYDQALNATAGSNEQDDCALQGDRLNRSGGYDSESAPPQSTPEELEIHDAQYLFPSYTQHDSAYGF